MSSILRVIPITLREASGFIDRYHRHHRRSRGHIFSIAAADPERREVEPYGVAVFGRPVAQGRQNGTTGEVLRVCARPDAPKGTASFLYVRCKRAAQTLGYLVQGSYTLASEPGDSLRGAGAVPVHTVKGRSWNAPSRPRHDNHPTEDKTLWEWYMDPVEAKVD